MLRFDEPIFYGRLVKRYKRFFMDVLLDDGTLVTAHTPNTGSMMGLLHENFRVLLTKHNNSQRVCAYTAQAIEIDGKFVGINTHAPNKLITASLAESMLSDLQGYQTVKAEVPYGQDGRSRVDFVFSDSVTNTPTLYLEIKNVTLKLEDIAQFPDAVSTRALKHIEDLIGVMKQGYLAALWFIVQRQDCEAFKPASSIDRAYAKALRLATHQGLRVRALAARCDEAGLAITHELPCLI